ncbi:MAG: hypothetical protein M1840_006346 [Geoglossum simile]|nr:MAG: hypothetical protein M1840_006346 [Geoglossum simile]
MQGNESSPDTPLDPYSREQLDRYFRSAVRENLRLAAIVDRLAKEREKLETCLRNEITLHYRSMQQILALQVSLADCLKANSDYAHQNQFLYEHIEALWKEIQGSGEEMALPHSLSSREHRDGE